MKEIFQLFFLTSFLIPLFSPLYGGEFDQFKSKVTNLWYAEEGVGDSAFIEFEAKSINPKGNYQEPKIKVRFKVTQDGRVSQLQYTHLMALKNYAGFNHLPDWKKVAQSDFGFVSHIPEDQFVGSCKRIPFLGQRHCVFQVAFSDEEVTTISIHFNMLYWNEYDRKFNFEGYMLETHSDQGMGLMHNTFEFNSYQ